MWDDAVAQATRTFVSVLPVLNPIAALPLFVSLTVGAPDAYRRQQARLVAVYVIAIMAVALLAGHLVLRFFGVSVGELQIAGGLIVAHTGWEMVASTPRLTQPEADEASTKGDIAFTPMALPMLSGPGVIALLIGTAARTPGWGGYLGSLVAIVLLGVICYVCLLLADPLTKRLGATGMGALNRVMGFLILAIAVNFVVEGIQGVVRHGWP
jgi:multiple antibiotic resistance protein